MMNPIGLRTDVSLDPPPPPTGAISERVGREKKEKKLPMYIQGSPLHVCEDLCCNHTIQRYDATPLDVWDRDSSAGGTMAQDTWYVYTNVHLRHYVL